MSRHPKFILLVWLCLVSALLPAQSLIRTYTVGDGLVMNRVRGFHQDRDGFIWMYTWDGLSRYEGYRFRNYRARKQLKHSFINDILEMNNGTMYLPLNDGSLAVMHHLEVDSSVLMPGDVINCFCKDDKGQVVVGTDHSGMCFFENGKLNPLKNDARVKAVIQIIYYKDHFFFIGPYEGPSGVCDRQMNLVKEWKGPSAYFTSIYQDPDEQIYVCTIDGLKQVNLSGTSFDLKEASIIPPNAPWKNWNVSSVIITHDHDAWLGTNQGLIHLRADHSWSVLTVADGLLSNLVNTLFLDKSNTLWIGTDAGAASINLQTNIINNLDMPGIYTNFVLPVDSGNAVVITGHKNVNKVNSHCQIVQNIYQQEDQNEVLALVPTEQSISMISLANIQELNFTHSGSIENGFNAGGFITNLNHHWWEATRSGFQCASSTGTFSTVPEADYFPFCISSSHNFLIIGTLKNGVLVAEPVDPEMDCSVKIRNNLNPYINDLSIRSMLTAKNGDLWIGTRFSGVIRLQCNEDFSECKPQMYTIDDGLNSNWITSFVEDQVGNIWVGSASGIDKLMPRGDHYFVFPFSRINGFYAYVRHLAADANGVIWVGHNEGLARITDGRIDTIGPSKTFITEVNLGGNEYPAFHDAPVQLPFDENSAHFAFSSPDYINVPQLMFTYRLEGSKENKWSPPVRTHEIFYGNLTPGKFKFEVATFGWNGERSEPTSYAFEILRPFWMQTWFILFAISLVIASLFGLYRFRVSQMQKVQSVRDRIAADLHDEIGSSLTHINILSEIGRKEHQPQNGDSHLFDRIGAEVQSSSEALDDIIWSVRTRRDAIGDVIARMRQYATEIFEPAGISFSLQEKVEGLQSFGMEFKRDFYLVYKELLRNVLKHAKATHVDIRIQVDRSAVAIQVKDNGLGFDIEAPTERSGLFNIRNRVNKWQGTASWDSIPGQGTTAHVEMQPG